jgi:CubicO group peptidase (beta-lactamase class C family)
MTSTRRDIPSELITNSAALYEAQSNRTVNCRWVNPTLFNNGDGGLLTTVVDMAKWDAALYPGKLFKSSALEQIWSPVSFGGTALKHYGFGWYLNETGAHRIALHGGGRPGSSTQISRFLDDKITVVVLMNRSGINAERMAHFIAAFYIPNLPPYPAPGLQNPPKWSVLGELVPASSKSQ